MFPQKAEKLINDFSLDSNTPIFTDYKEMLKSIKKLKKYNKAFIKEYLY